MREPACFRSQPCRCCNPLVDEPSTDGVLGFVDPSVESLAILDQGAKLTVLLGRRVYRFEFSHGGQTGKLQSVVFVGLAFDIGPPPGFFVGGADERGKPHRLSQIVDPARGSAGLHDDQVRLVVGKDRSEVLPPSGRGEEPSLAGPGVEKAAGRVEFAEVECENLHWISVLAFGGWSECDRHSPGTFATLRMTDHLNE